jgi:hypothetical protein
MFDRVAVALVAAGATLLGLAGCGRRGEQMGHEVLRSLDQGKIVGTKGTMETYARALSACALDRGGYPQGSSIEQAHAVLSPAFLAFPPGVDAWGHPFAYQSDGRSFTLTAPGADGRAGTDDDLVMVDGTFTRLPAPSRP